MGNAPGDLSLLAFLNLVLTKKSTTKLEPQKETRSKEQSETDLDEHTVQVVRHLEILDISNQEVAKELKRTPHPKQSPGHTWREPLVWGPGRADRFLLCVAQEEQTVPSSSL